MKLCSVFRTPNPTQRDRWKQVKARGKKNFVFRVGVIQWGGFMFVMMTAGDLLRKSAVPRRAIDYAFDIALNLLVWPLVGYCFGIVLWRFYESHFSEDHN